MEVRIVREDRPALHGWALNAVTSVLMRKEDTHRAKGLAKWETEIGVM